MKALSSVAAAIAVAVLPLCPLALHAQDQPPPMDQSAAPPAPPDQGYAPQPGQDQGVPPPDQGGDDSGASFDQFYNGLSSEGQWIQTPDYGYVFQPEVTDPNWAPYTEGHWVYTDYGWTWASDEPWGWATYHYGRWVNLYGTGWVWVPGYEWAPAWVSWRYGGGYCGWAPLPPSTFIGVEFGGSGVNFGFDFHFGGDVDTAYGIGPGYYNFIPIGYIGDPSYHRWYVDRGRNFAIINNTTNITNIYVSRHPGAGAFSAVRVQGPALAQVNAVSHTPVQQVRLAGTSQPGASRLSGGTLSVFAPHINASSLHTSRPTNVSQTLSTVKVNRGVNVSQPLQVNARYKPAAPSAEVVAAAKSAQLHAPASVATASRIKPTARLSTPLTSMQTVGSQRRPSSTGGNAFAPAANTQVQHSSTYNGNGGYTPNANASVQHTPSYSPSGGGSQNNAEAQHEGEVRQQQAESQQHSQEQAEAQERAQQQHDEEVRQQQAATAEHAQQEREAEERQQAAASQQRAAAAEAAAEHNQQVQHSFAQPQVQQHVSQPQVQQHASSPQPQPQQHASQGGGNGGGGGNGNKNNPYGNSQSH